MIKENKMKKIILLLAIGFLSAGVYAQNSPVPPVSGVPPVDGAAARPGAERENEALLAPSVISTAPVSAVPATIEELKMKQGRAVAELKKKQQEELKQMKVSSAPETRGDIRAKKKEHRQAVQSLKDAHGKEMVRFKKDHPAPEKKIKPMTPSETPALEGGK
ncbi:MAG: hypothetical protein A2X33_09715 [Elusimicrobia bacterium GWA2_51_34]|nr:MAG: hypothetical protein A2X33_09715 [Elusimicrobia bacterium GWA2_51_34]HAF95010.1 hypothetical protein [Elusimicrobiota bacterium]